jgi:hypothetical protein
MTTSLEMKALGCAVAAALLALGGAWAAAETIRLLPGAEDPGAAPMETAMVVAPQFADEGHGLFHDELRRMPRRRRARR